jgi:hypothetical protein
MEPLDNGRVAYPYYHMIADSLGRIDVEQTARIADIGIGFLNDCASRPAEIAILPSDVLLRYRGRPTIRREFASGDTVEVWVRARNIGASYPSAGATVNIQMRLETAAGTRFLQNATVPAPAALDMTGIVLPLILGSENAGENIVRASISVMGMEDDGRNNDAAVRFSVETTGGPVLRHSVQPNPVRGSFPAACFCLDLARPIDAHLELFTLEGERVGNAYLGERWGSALRPGLCCVPFGNLFPNIDALASGVYLYRLIAYEGPGQSKLLGRFAVEH